MFTWELNTILDLTSTDKPGKDASTPFSMSSTHLSGEIRNWLWAILNKSNWLFNSLYKPDDWALDTGAVTVTRKGKKVKGK